MSITKKIVSTIVGLSMVAMMAPGLAQALTAEELQAQIDTLLAQLATLQTQLSTLQGTAAPAAGAPAACTGITFSQNLKQGMSGNDVKCLQALLNQSADTQVAVSGAGSPGNETTYFGPLTKAAVIKFQEKYAADILASYGLTAGTGFVGTTTRAKLNSLLTAAPVTPPVTPTACTTDANCPAGQVCQSGACVTPAPVTGVLNVALAADTPPVQLIPAGPAQAASNVPFLKVTFTGTGNVSKVIVTRGGVSTDADLTGVKLFDGDVQLGITQTFNAQHQAVFTLTTPWAVSGTKTLTIAGDYALGNSGQIIMSIQSASDVTADTTVGGTFPIVGNAATGSPLTNVGNLTVDNGSLQPVGGGTVDVDATNFIFLQMKLTAGAAEDVLVKAITVARGIAATIVGSDVTNIVLYNDTTGAELGRATAFGTDSKVTFTLATPLLLEKGRFVEISVRADVLSGSGRNIAFDINDGVAYTILATGKSYGYGVALAAGNFNGIGPATGINQGILNVSRGANCPATGNVAVGGSDIKLGSFNFKVRGEQIRIGRIIVSLDRVDGGAVVAGELSLVKLVDSTGNVLAGPVTPTQPAANDYIATFTSSVTLSPGDNELYVVANLANNAALANLQYQVGFDGAVGGTPGGGVALANVRGLTSNLAIVPTPAANVLGNVMTARMGALTADMTATPVAGNVIVGGQKATLANLKLDATASGEDVRITRITIQKAGTEPLALGTLSDIELWDGSTQVGLTQQPATNNITFTLTTPLVVTKGTSKILAVKANLLATTLAGRTHTWALVANGAGDPTCSGNVVCATTSGAPVVATVPGAISPAQALQVNGNLRVTVDATPVTSAQLVAGSTNNEVVRYKFWAVDEDFDVTQIFVCASDTTAGGTSPASAAADIASASIWMGGTQISGNVPVSIGPANAIAPALVGLPSGTLVVPKNGNKVISLKVSFNEKVSLTSDTDYQFGICDGAGSDAGWGFGGGVDYSIVAIGLSSGAQIGRIPGGAVVTAIADAAGDSYGGNVMEVFDGKLTVALNASSPSGTATPGANKEVMRLDLTAVGDDITLTGLTLTANSTSAWDNVADNVQLTNVDGTLVYDTSVNATDSFDNGTAIAFPNGAWTNQPVIAEGTTLTIKVIGNTTGAGLNDTLQLSIVNALTHILWTDVEGGGAGAGTDVVGTQTVPLYGNTLRY